MLWQLASDFARDSERWKGANHAQGSDLVDDADAVLDDDDDTSDVDLGDDVLDDDDDDNVSLDEIADVATENEEN